MKNTTELLHQIRNHRSPDFVTSSDYNCPSIRYYLSDLLRLNSFTSIAYFRELNIDKSYGYQILNGKRQPTREMLLQTAILFHLDYAKTQRLLKIGKREVLYPRVRKDALTIFALENNLSLQEYQVLLESYEEF